LYFISSNCNKCFEDSKFLGMTRTPKDMSVSINYKRYESFWGLSYFSFNEQLNMKYGKTLFGSVYLIFKLGGKLKKDAKQYFPRSMYQSNNHTVEFFVNDIYLQDDIGFDGDNVMKKEIVDQINTDNRDIWGKYNYLEHSISKEDKKQE